MQNNLTVRIALCGLLIAANAIMAMEVALEEETSSPARHVSKHIDSPRPDYRTLMMSTQSGRTGRKLPSPETTSENSLRTSTTDTVTIPLLDLSSLQRTQHNSSYKAEIGQILVDNPINISPVHSPSVSGSRSPSEETEVIDLSKDDIVRRRPSAQEITQALNNLKKSSSSLDSFSAQEETTTISQENEERIGIFSSITVPHIPIYEGIIVKDLDNNYHLTYGNDGKFHTMRILARNYNSELPYVVIQNNKTDNLFNVKVLPKDTTNRTNRSSSDSLKKQPTPKNNKNYMYSAVFGGTFIVVMIYAAYKYHKLDGLINLLNNLKSNCNNLIPSRFSR